MAHELNQKANGQAAMAYVGATPWHQLGQRMEPDATLEDWKTAAGLNWTAEKKPVLFIDSTGEQKPVPGRFVLSRSDTNHPFEVVSAQYQPVQPDTIMDFFGAVIRNNGFRMETLGALFNGEKIFALARAGDVQEVVSGDAVAPFLLLATSFDKSSPTLVTPTTVRVVCKNTLAMAVHEESSKAFRSVRVVHRTAFNPTAVRSDLGLHVASSFERFMANSKALAAKQVNYASFERFMQNLLATNVDGKLVPLAINEARKHRTFEKVQRLFDMGIGADIPAVRGTGWGLVNAVTEYVDHGRNPDNFDKRYDSALFGDGANLKARAMELATAL